MNLEILYQDNHIIAVNKACGIAVQSDESGDETLIDKVKEYIKHKYNKPGAVFLGLPHRLDRPVSGVILLARTSKALERLNKMFKEQEIQKIYWAIVKEMPPQQTETLTHYLIRDGDKNKSFAYDKHRDGSKKASLTYTLLAASSNFKLLEIQLHTGRHHQIRTQLAKIGCPIKGDLKYGFPRSNTDGGISLHARSITFNHPVTQQAITISAKPPTNDNLWRFFAQSLMPSTIISST